MTRGIITGIQRLCLHDGPGLRTTVFFKGCPMRCRWCHNPETQSPRPQPLLHADKCVGCGACEAVCPEGCHRMEGRRFESARCSQCMRCVQVCPSGALEACGQFWESALLADRLARDLPFFGETGGVTLSGGEPTFQPEFALALLDELKARKIDTAMETCGAFPAALLDALLPRVDHFLWDVKDTDPERHLKNTGYPLAPILDNLARACAAGADVCVRGIIVKGVNALLEHAEKLGKLARQLGAGDCRLLRFHPYYSAKLTSVGRPDEAMGQAYVPDDKTMERLTRTMQNAFGRACVSPGESCSQIQGE
ncbi:MAG: glycyl-radical enzyme activating protein [Clostridia bacterium]|nr:glycyl-radical enzyme activating protein [Clostridia bacterium]